MHRELTSFPCGVGIAVSNLATGAALDLTRSLGILWAPWSALFLIGIASASGVHTLSHADRLQARPVPVS